LACHKRGCCSTIPRGWLQCGFRSRTTLKCGIICTAVSVDVSQPSQFEANGNTALRECSGPHIYRMGRQTGDAGEGPFEHRAGNGGVRGGRSEGNKRAHHQAGGGIGIWRPHGIKRRHDGARSADRVSARGRNFERIGRAMYTRIGDVGEKGKEGIGGDARGVQGDHQGCKGVSFVCEGEGSQRSDFAQDGFGDKRDVVESRKICERRWEHGGPRNERRNRTIIKDGQRRGSVIATNFALAQHKESGEWQNPSRRTHESARHREKQGRQSHRVWVSIFAVPDWRGICFWRGRGETDGRIKDAQKKFSAVSRSFREGSNTRANGLRPRRIFSVEHQSARKRRDSQGGNSAQRESSVGSQRDGPTDGIKRAREDGRGDRDLKIRGLRIQQTKGSKGFYPARGRTKVNNIKEFTKDDERFDEARKRDDEIAGCEWMRNGDEKEPTRSRKFSR